MIPVIGVVTQTPSLHHQAVDISCIHGSEVRAMGKGYGSFSWSHTKGWTFTQGDIAMSHLMERGQDGEYERGDVIGACGSTGVYSTGPHIHLEGPPEILSTFH